jgi:hypothetical protein
MMCRGAFIMLTALLATVNAHGAAATQESKPDKLVLACKFENRVYHIGEPIWLTLQVTNVSQDRLPIMYDAGDSEGIEFEFDKAYARDIAVVQRSIPVDVIERVTKLAPGASISKYVLLNDFLRFRKPGKYSLRAVFAFSEAPGQPQGLLHSGISISVGAPLTVDEAEKLVSAEEAAFKRGTGQERERAIRSAGFVPVDVSAGLFRMGLSDQDEDVQFVTVNVVSRIKGPTEITRPLLKTALASRFESVRLAAKEALGVKDQNGALPP